MSEKDKTSSSGKSRKSDDEGEKSSSPAPSSENGSDDDSSSGSGGGLLARLEAAAEAEEQKFQEEEAAKQPVELPPEEPPEDPDAKLTKFQRMAKRFLPGRYARKLGVPNIPPDPPTEIEVFAYMMDKYEEAHVDYMVGDAVLVFKVSRGEGGAHDGYEAAMRDSEIIQERIKEEWGPGGGMGKSLFLDDVSQSLGPEEELGPEQPEAVANDQEITGRVATKETASAGAQSAISGITGREATKETASTGARSAISGNQQEAQPPPVASPAPAPPSPQAESAQSAQNESPEAGQASAAPAEGTPPPAEGAPQVAAGAPSAQTSAAANEGGANESAAGEGDAPANESAAKARWQSAVRTIQTSEELPPELQPLPRPEKGKKKRVMINGVPRYGRWIKGRVVEEFENQVLVKVGTDRYIPTMSSKPSQKVADPRLKLMEKCSSYLRPRDETNSVKDRFLEHKGLAKEWALAGRDFFKEDRGRQSEERAVEQLRRMATSQALVVADAGKGAAKEAAKSSVVTFKDLGSTLAESVMAPLKPKLPTHIVGDLEQSTVVYSKDIFKKPVAAPEVGTAEYVLALAGLSNEEKDEVKKILSDSRVKTEPALHQMWFDSELCQFRYGDVGFSDDRWGREHAHGKKPLGEYPLAQLDPRPANETEARAVEQVHGMEKDCGIKFNEKQFREQVFDEEKMMWYSRPVKVKSAPIEIPKEYLVVTGKAE